MDEADNLNPKFERLIGRTLVGAILLAFASVTLPAAAIHLENKLAAQDLDNQEMQIAGDF